MTKHQRMQSVPYTRIYTDENGHSHFSDERINLFPSSFGPDDDASASGDIAANTMSLLHFDSDWDRPMGPAPTVNFWTLLSGKTESTTSLGVTRAFAPGELILFTDITGEGHSSRSISNQPVVWLRINPVVNVFSLFGLLDFKQPVLAPKDPEDTK